MHALVSAVICFEASRAKQTAAVSAESATAETKAEAVSPVQSFLAVLPAEIAKLHATTVRPALQSALAGAMLLSFDCAPQAIADDTAGLIVPRRAVVDCAATWKKTLSK